MLRQDLANKLVSAKTETDRRTLLERNPEFADERLAYDLKEICYAAWTNEPTVSQKTKRAVRSLLKFNQNPEIEALSLWISGIADLTCGKLESAIDNLDKSAAVFKTLRKEDEAANTQVAKLYALALLGKYDEAITCGEQTLKTFVKLGDEIAAGKIENNLGNIFIRQDLMRQAEKYYLAAQKRFIKNKDAEQLLLSEIGLANTYAALNDFQQASMYYHKTLLGAQELKMLVREAEIETNIGSLALFRGKYDEALKYLEISRRIYEVLKMPHQSTIAELEIADVYLELNLAEEAFSIYEKVTNELNRLKIQGEEARARANFGRSAILLDQTIKARTELKKSARLYLAEKNKVGAASVLLSEANLELNLKNFEKALPLTRQAEKLLKRSDNLRHKLTAQFLKGEILRNLGKFTEAEKLLSQTSKNAIKQEQLSINQITLNALGNLALQTKNVRKARKYFEMAIEHVERLRAPLPAEEFRMAFLADKLAPFENLAKIHLAENNLESAFFSIEKARSRSLLENLDGAGSSGNKTNQSSKLADKLGSLREELNWFYSRLNRAEEAEIKDLQRHAKDREMRISEVMRQIESTGSIQVGPAEPGKKSEGFEKLQKQLGKQKALIEFVTFDNELSAFVISETKIEYVAGLAKESDIIELLEGLHFQFGALRFGTKNLEKFMPELKKRADFYLQKLYEKLLSPLNNFLENRDLVIVPVGALHYVPFHALRDGENYLIQTREIVCAPGAAVWQKLTSKPVNNLKNALFFGFADERIPLVTQEIDALERIFDESKSFTGKSASFANYADHAPDFDILHLACHGQFRPENPLFSSLQLSDGHVIVRDIYAQKLRAKLVVLSACETGLNKIFAGEEILGLSRGFLTAGANSLVLSLWTVNDEATAELMVEFYTEVQRGKEISASLQIAQRHFIEKGSHPYFWAPFAVIGR